MSTSTERRGMRAVRGYVRAVLRHKQLKRKALLAEADVRSRRGRMNGTQIGMAERLLRAGEATLGTLLEPCRGEENGSAQSS